MFEINTIKIKKAYILLNTLFIVTIIMLTIALFSKIIINEKESLYYFQQYIFKTQIDKKYKENLLTELNEFISKNMILSKRDDIKSYFTSYGKGNIVNFEKSLIKYSKDQDSFLLEYQFQDGILKCDQYKYDLINGKIKYTFTNSSYESGRL